MFERTGLALNANKNGRPVIVTIGDCIEHTSYNTGEIIITVLKQKTVLG